MESVHQDTLLFFIQTFSSGKVFPDLFSRTPRSMCEYKEIENIKLSNGKTIKQVNDEVRKEVERIYLEGWAKGISIPFKDEKGNIYLANPDGSEDLVAFNRKKRSYEVLSRVAQAGQGRYAYLIK